jgi:hypothetical protein
MNHPEDWGATVDYGLPRTRSVVGFVLAVTVVVILGLPWLTRFALWLGERYEAYAKWACQC